MYKRHTLCRACGSSNLVLAADFGVTPLVNAFVPPDAEQAGYAPLQIMLCEECWLPQLSVVVNPHILYDNYPYAHSTTETLQRHFVILEGLLRKHRPDLGCVLEIGSNDGLLLDFLRKLPGVTGVYGVDAAADLVIACWNRGIRAYAGLFDSRMARDVLESEGTFDIILARHVFAHIDDWKDVIAGFADLTTSESIVVLEVQYAPDLLANTEWDQVYHEHLSYVTIGGLARALEYTPFHIHDVHRVEYNGGSVVIVLRRNSSKKLVSPVVQEMIQAEPSSPALWEAFLERTFNLQDELWEVVFNLCRQGKKVGGYGAPAKCTNWIHACEFTKKEIAFVTDASPLKQGKLVPGSDIPVVSPDAIATEKPDAMILFAWNFEKEIVAKEKDFLDHGGRFIVPLPELHCIP